jgi:glutaredoxin 2
MNGWIGVDLDGTLAHYDEWEGIDVIGAPIIPMVNRVKSWLADGIEVRIFTARVGGPSELAAAARPHIEQWCREHIGRKLAVTATKDFGMYELWDDRAVQVECNTGRRMDNEPDEHWTP